MDCDRFAPLGNDILCQILLLIPFSKWRSLRNVSLNWNRNIIKLVEDKKKYIMNFVNRGVICYINEQDDLFLDMLHASEIYIDSIKTQIVDLTKHSDGGKYNTVAGCFPVSDFISEICLRLPYIPSHEHPGKTLVWRLINKICCQDRIFHNLFLYRAHISCYTYSFERFHKNESSAADLACKSITGIICDNIPAESIDLHKWFNGISACMSGSYDEDKLYLLKPLLGKHIRNIDWIVLIALVFGHISPKDSIWVKIIPVIGNTGLKHTPYDKWLTPDFLTALKVHGTKDHTEYIQYVKNTSIFYRKGVKHYEA